MRTPINQLELGASMQQERLLYKPFVLYLLVLFACMTCAFTVVQAQEAQVYYADQENGDIYRAMLDGSQKEAILDGDWVGPADVAIDEAEGKVYWTQRYDGPPEFRYRNGIWRANRDGSGREALITGLAYPFDIALDGMGKMYWRNVEGGDNVIQRANIDGTDLETIIVSDRLVKGVALDTIDEKVYWVTESQVFRANLDGTEQDTVLTEFLNFRGSDLAIDPVNEIVYIQGSNSSISTISFDATEVNQIVYQPDAWIRDITLDLTAGHLYWVASLNNVYTVYRANLNGTDVTSVITEDVRPVGIAIDESKERIYMGEEYKMTVARLDGMNLRAIVSASNIAGLKLDAAAGKVVWIDNGLQRIQRANLDGSGMENVIEVTDARGLALDPDGQMIYWQEVGTGTIHRVAYDGTGSETVAEFATPNTLGAFTINPDDGYMYWTNRDEDYIEQANLDGTNRSVFYTPEGGEGIHVYNYVEVDLENNHIYWLGTESGLGVVLKKADLEGDPNEVVIDFKGYKSGYRDIRLGPDGDFLYVLRWSINPPIFRESLVVYYVKEDPLTPDPFYDLSARSPERITSIDFDWRYIDPPVINGIANFSLVDARANEIDPYRGPIADGEVIDIKRYDRGLNIVANTTGNVGSVLFEFKGQNPFRIENEPPYALFGDLAGDYEDGYGQFGTGGIFTLTAKAYSEDGARGTLIGSKTITFTANNGIAVKQLYLYDAEAKSILFLLEDGAMLNLDELPEKLTIYTDVLTKTRYVRFELEPEGYVHTESKQPFMLFGDFQDVYFSRPFAVGEHTLTVYPYEGPDFGDFNGPPYTITFTTYRGSAPGAANGLDDVAKANQVPETFALESNYPNPFNPVTTITYQLPEAAHARLVVYDMYGREVRTLVNEPQSAGRYEVVFDAGTLASGTYVYRMVAGEFTETKLMVLVK